IRDLIVTGVQTCALPISLRCDANVSLKPAGAARLGTKVEIKNMNSFRNVQRALEFEVTRQAEALDRGERLVQETRLWDADRGYKIGRASGRERAEVRVGW